DGLATRAPLDQTTKRGLVRNVYRFIRMRDEPRIGYVQNVTQQQRGFAPRFVTGQCARAVVEQRARGGHCVIDAAFWCAFDALHSTISSLVCASPRFTPGTWSIFGLK